MHSLRARVGIVVFKLGALNRCIVVAIIWGCLLSGHALEGKDRVKKILYTFRDITSFPISLNCLVDRHPLQWGRYGAYVYPSVASARRMLRKLRFHSETHADLLRQLVKPVGGLFIVRKDEIVDLFFLYGYALIGCW